MSIPIDAIDPEAGYRQWLDSFYWHIDQLPLIIETTGVLVLPRLRAKEIQERVSGGGYVDNIPVADGPATRDTMAAWAALRAYLACAASHLYIESLSIPVALPGDVDDARWWAHEARAWLARVVDRIRAWPDLVELEHALFALIRRASGRQPDTPTPAEQEMGQCEVCGKSAVLIDWIDGGLMLAKACTVCGTKYSDSS